MTKKTIIVLSLTGVALLGAGLWYYFAHKNTQEYTLVTVNPALKASRLDPIEALRYE